MRMKKDGFLGKLSFEVLLKLRSRGLADDVHKKGGRRGRKLTPSDASHSFGHRPVFVVDLAGADGVGAQAVEVRGDAVFKAG